MLEYDNDILEYLMWINTISSNKLKVKEIVKNIKVGICWWYIIIFNI